MDVPLAPMSRSRSPASIALAGVLGISLGAGVLLLSRVDEPAPRTIGVGSSLDHHAAGAEGLLHPGPASQSLAAELTPGPLGAETVLRAQPLAASPAASPTYAGS